jgi:hypothetical protein
MRYKSMVEDSKGPKIVAAGYLRLVGVKHDSLMLGWVLIDTRTGV